MEHCVQTNIWGARACDPAPQIEPRAAREPIRSACSTCTGHSYPKLNGGTTFHPQAPVHVNASAYRLPAPIIIGDVDPMDDAQQRRRRRRQG